MHEETHMSYYQMTLTDWLSIKNSLRDDLAGVSKSFVRIGYKLRRIEEQKLYENDGYKSLAEFAKAEYGLSQSTTSRFMAINAKYSIGGYSEDLRPEFAALGSSKLSEMLTLPDADLQMITEETPREAIRELKAFEKAAPAFDGVELVEALHDANRDTIAEWYHGGMGTDRLKDLLNPSGARTFRKGVWFLMMYEADVKVKKFPEAPKSMSWEELADRIREVCGETEGEYVQRYEGDAGAHAEAADRGNAGHEQDAGGHGSAEVHDQHAERPDAPAEGEGGRDAGHDRRAEHAPAAVAAGEGGRTAEDAGADPETAEGHAGAGGCDPAPAGHQTEDGRAEDEGADQGGRAEPVESGRLSDYAPAHMNAPEEPDVVWGTRWKFMKTLRPEEMAMCLIDAYQARTLTTFDLMKADVAKITEWLTQPVNKDGETV